MKNVIKIAVMILLLGVISCSATEKTAPDLNEKRLIEVYQQTLQDDGGYRPMNEQIGYHASTSLYLREAKVMAGLEVKALPEALKASMFEKYYDKNMGGQLSVPETFQIIQLINDKDSLKNYKDVINEYYDSLFDSGEEGYFLEFRNSSKPQFDSVYSVYTTSFISTIAHLTDYEPRYTENWLDKRIKEFLDPETFDPENILSAYRVMDLCEKSQKTVSKEILIGIKEKCDKYLKENFSTAGPEKESSDITEISFLEGYTGFCTICGFDFSENHDIILDRFVDDEGIKVSLAKEDPQILYQICHILKLCEYNFKDHTNGVFSLVDQYQLTNGLYAPSSEGSNLINTFYADMLYRLKNMNIEGYTENLQRYLKKADMSSLLEADPVNLYCYLTLLKNNGLLDTLDQENREKIITRLSEFQDTILSTADEHAPKDYLRLLNGTIKGLNLLQIENHITKDQATKILDTFLSETGTINLYDMIAALELGVLIVKDDEVTKKLTTLTEEALYNVRPEESVDELVIFYGKSAEVLGGSDQALSGKLKKKILEILESCYDDEAGLYRAGDGVDETISFQSNYYAVLLNNLK